MAKSPAQLDREIAIATARTAEQKLAAIARTRRPTEAETQEALRAYAAAAEVAATTARVGQLFDRLGHIYEITKIGRDKKRTLQVARRVRDPFGKEVLIDHRSFPARDLDREYLRPIDAETAARRGYPGRA